MKNFRLFFCLMTMVVLFTSTGSLENVIVGNLVDLVQLPPATGDEGDNETSNKEDEDGDDNENEGKEKPGMSNNPRSLTYSAFYLSLDDHTIYAYPDGMHDVMTLWVCDMQGNVIEEVLFEMNGTRQSHVLPPSLAGEYEVYLKVGTQYYVGGIDL